MAESKEFIKALFVDWANYYRCSGSPTKTKDVNKAWREWQGTITPSMKKEAKKTGEFKTRQFCDKK
jgi:hypothetical protein